MGVDVIERDAAGQHQHLGVIEQLADLLRGTLAALAGKGIEPERPPYAVREGGARICFVRDPDGYRVELIERE